MNQIQQTAPQNANPEIGATVEEANFAQTEDPGKVFAIISLVIFFTGMNVIGLGFAIYGFIKSKSAGRKNTLALVMIYIHAIWVALALILAVAFVIYVFMTGDWQSILNA